MLYPATFVKDDPTHSITVSFRDLPEAITSGFSHDEAIEMAEDALSVVMEFYFEKKKPIPLPSNFTPEDIPIRLPASISAKALLLNEMIKQNISQVELAKRLNIHRQAVGRILSLKHVTSIDTIEQAFKVLNKELSFSVK